MSTQNIFETFDEEPTATVYNNLDKVEEDGSVTCGNCKRNWDGNAQCDCRVVDRTFPFNTVESPMKKKDNQGTLDRFFQMTQATKNDPKAKPMFTEKKEQTQQVGAPSVTVHVTLPSSSSLQNTREVSVKVEDSPKSEPKEAAQVTAGLLDFECQCVMNYMCCVCKTTNLIPDVCCACECDYFPDCLAVDDNNASESSLCSECFDGKGVHKDFYYRLEANNKEHIFCSQAHYEKYREQHTKADLTSAKDDLSEEEEKEVKKLEEEEKASGFVVEDDKVEFRSDAESSFETGDESYSPSESSPSEFEGSDNADRDKKKRKRQQSEDDDEEEHESEGKKKSKETEQPKKCKGCKGSWESEKFIYHKGQGWFCSNACHSEWEIR